MRGVGEWERERETEGECMSEQNITFLFLKRDTKVDRTIFLLLY